MHEESKEKFKKIVEDILEPLGGKVKTFHKPYTITWLNYTSTGVVERPETVYPMSIEAGSKEIPATLSSDLLSTNSGYAAWHVCYFELCTLINQLEKAEKDVILDRLFSDQFSILTKNI